MKASYTPAVTNLNVGNPGDQPPVTGIGERVAGCDGRSQSLRMNEPWGGWEKAKGQGELLSEPQEGIVDKRPEMSTRERIPRALWDAILGVMS